MFTFHNKYKDAFPLPKQGEGWLSFEGNTIRYYIDYNVQHRNSVVITINGNISDNTSVNIHKCVYRTHNMWRIQLSHTTDSFGDEAMFNSCSTITYTVKNLNKLPDSVRLIIKHICAAICKVNQQHHQTMKKLHTRHKEHIYDAFNQLLKRIDDSADKILLGNKGCSDDDNPS